MDYVTVFCLGGFVGSIFSISVSGMSTFTLTIYDKGWFPNGLRFKRVEWL